MFQQGCMAGSSRASAEFSFLFSLFFFFFNCEKSSASCLVKYGSVRNRICFIEVNFGESCPQKETKPKDRRTEGILGVMVLTP